MKQLRMTALAAAMAAAYAFGLPVHAATDRLPVSAAERSKSWFVEFESAPTADGGVLANVRNEKARFRQRAAAAGIKFKERRAFDVLFNGISIEVSAADRLKLSRLPGVKAMYPVEVIRAPKPIRNATVTKPDLTTALTMTGADTAQRVLGLSGKGIKVGIIDTGIDIDHQNLGGGGTPGGTAFPTHRVAYGYDFVGDAYNADPDSPTYNPVPVPDNNPDDCAGHGTHVAGIVGASGSLKGVAPRVTFGAYRVFGCDGSTDSDIMIAAMERAYADGMQVINQSIGAAFQNFPEYPTGKAASILVKKGVVMVASIGNSGTSGLYAAGSPGVGEKVIGVASYDNAFVSLPQFTISPDSKTIGYEQATGAPPAPTSGTDPMARTGTSASVDDACAPLAPTSLTGQVALIRRGGCAFHIKSLNAQNAGAKSVVIYNNVPGRINATVEGDPPITIPVVTVSDSEGMLIDSRLAMGPVSMTWTDTSGTFPNVTGGLISSFSSFGLAADLSLKPNIGAPGGLIYSTYPLEQGGYAVLSGTSMASPHVAGGAALVLESNPDINAKDMRDRLQNTADPKNWNLNPGLGFLDNVHRQGAGMLDIVETVQSSSIVFPGELALGESQNGPVTKTLTLKNKGGSHVTYTLSHVPALATGPNTFLPAFFNAPATVAFSSTSVSVAPKSSATVNVTVTPNSSLADKSLYGGYVVISQVGSGKVMRVPYAGFKGDYQSIEVITKGGFGFPWLTKIIDGFYVNQPDGATYTMAGIDIPFFLVHLDHQAKHVRLDAYDAATGASVGRVSKDVLVPRNATATGFYEFIWDGMTYTDSTPPAPVPNGTYIVKVRALKALGDPTSRADTEYWASPPVTVARP